MSEHHVQMLGFCRDIFFAGAISFGGLAAVLSPLRANIVDRDHFLTNEQFTESYGLAVAAPGPNAIFLCLIGFQMAGVWGAVLAGAAWCIPTGLGLLLIARTSSSGANAKIKAFRKGLVPIVAGLLVAGAVASASTYEQPVRQWVMTAAILGVLLARPQWNPVWVVLGSALLGAFLLQPM